jgi:hypothetical protein
MGIRGVSLVEENKRLRKFFREVARLTANHHVINDYACIYASELGAQLDKIDSEWCSKVLPDKSETEIQLIESLKTVLDDTISSLRTGECVSCGTKFDEGRLYEAQGLRKTLDTLVRGHARLSHRKVSTDKTQRSKMRVFKKHGTAGF